MKPRAWNSSITAEPRLASRLPDAPAHEKRPAIAERFRDLFRESIPLDPDQNRPAAGSALLRMSGTICVLGRLSAPINAAAAVASAPVPFAASSVNRPT